MSTATEAETRDERPAIRPRTRIARAASEHLFGETARQGTLALTDQAIVSGTRFLTTILIGRYCGPEELGVYSLAFSFVLVVGCVLESLIAMPYTIYGNRLHGRVRTDYAGSSLVYALVLGVLLMIGLAAGAAVRLSPLLGILAVTIPSVLLWEFARFVSFAELRIVKALLLDVAMAAIQLGGLFWLSRVDHFSAVWAYVVVTVACGLSSVVWLYVSRRGFTFCREQIVPSFTRNWRFARWLFAGQATGALHYPLLLWLLHSICGIEATGIFAACMVVLLMCNPFLLGINNMLIPKVARAFARGGRSEVQRVVWKSTLFFGAAMCLVCVLVMLFGDPAMQLLYGSRYGGQWATLAILALATVTTASGLTINNGLWAIERPDLSFRASALALLVTAATAAVCVPLWGVPGAACGMFSGTAASAIARYVQFIRSAHAAPAQGEAA